MGATVTIPFLIFQSHDGVCVCGYSKEVAFTGRKTGAALDWIARKVLIGVGLITLYSSFFFYSFKIGS